jgi:outer membrane protein TolC
MYRLLLLLLFFTQLNCGILKVSLSETEQTALTQNKQIKALENLLRKAEMGKLEAVSKWLPQVEAMQGAFFSTEDQILVNAKSGFVAQIALTQSVFQSDVYYGIKLAALNVEHLRLLLLAAKNDILFQTRAIYYKVVLDNNTLATRREHVELMGSLALQMRDNFDRGTAKLYTVNQAKVAAANATTRYYAALKQIKVSEDQLLKVMGYDPGAYDVEITQMEIPVQEIPELKHKIVKVEQIFNEFTLDDSIYNPNFPETQCNLMQNLFSSWELAEWEAIALHERPGILQQKNQVEIAQEMIKKGYGEYLPSMDIQSGYGAFQSPWSEQPTTSFFNQNFSLNVGFRFKWMLFDGLGRERRIAGAKAEKRASIFQLQEERQKTLADVREQIFSIESSIAQFITAEGNVRLSRQTIEQAKEQLQIGYMTIFDYQIAVDSYIEAENIRNKARFDLITAYYGLRQVSGIDMEREYE